MISHEVFIHIHQGCFAGTGAIVRLPQCQRSKPGGYGKISRCITTTKHSKAKTVCIFLVMCWKCKECLKGPRHYLKNIDLSSDVFSGNHLKAIWHEMSWTQSIKCAGLLPFTNQYHIPRVNELRQTSAGFTIFRRVLGSFSWIYIIVLYPWKYLYI